MANEQDKNPSTGTESDISKSQSQQQPQGQAGQQSESRERSGQFETGQQGREEFAQDQSASPDEGQQGETLAQQRTDVEGASRGTPESGEAESGFVGSEGKKDTSSELVEDQEFDKGGQGAPDTAE